MEQESWHKVTRVKWKSNAVRRMARWSRSKSVQFDGLSPGSYAISIVHDENANGRMDAFLGIPREGFGFSGNAAPRLGPPSFREAAIELKSGPARHDVRMRYLL